jgi:hypothetical protein
LALFCPTSKKYQEARKNKKKKKDEKSRKGIASKPMPAEAAREITMGIWLIVAHWFNWLSDELHTDAEKNRLELPA